MSSEAGPSTTLSANVSVSKESKHLDHILIAVDGSPSADFAFKWAMDKLIDPAKNVIYLLSVAKVNSQTSMIYSAGLGGGIPWNMLEDLSKESTEEARKTVIQYHHLLRERFQKNLEIHCLIGQGDPRDEIVDAVERTQADLLVLGNRGLGGLKRTFLGSTGDYCLHHANCPVTIVKESK